MARKIFHITASVITWVTLLLAAALVVPKLAGYCPYVVLSGSMEPSVKTGSLAYVSTAKGTWQVGSIIAYKLSDGTAVIHRIAGIDEETGDYITKGDSNEAADGAPVPEESILGLYVFSIPGVGYFLQGLKAPLLLPVCGLICALLALNLADYAFCENQMKDKQIPRQGVKGGILNV